MDIWVRRQVPQWTVNPVAEAVGVPLDDIRIHSLYQGATFGGIEFVDGTVIPAILAAIFAKRTGRPVMAITPSNNWFSLICEEYGYYKFKVGAKSDGTITAVQILSNVCPAPGSGSPGTEKLVEATSIKNFYCDDTVAWLNLPPQVCYRHGTSETIPFSEIMNRVAAELGLDPTLVALKNDGCSGKPMHPDIDNAKEKNGFPLRDSLKECIEEGKNAIGWDEK